MAWVRPRAGCSCLVCGGPWPWVRWGENEAVRFCVCVCVRACATSVARFFVTLCLERLCVDE